MKLLFLALLCSCSINRTGNDLKKSLELCKNNGGLNYTTLIGYHSNNDRNYCNDGSIIIRNKLDII